VTREGSEATAASLPRPDPAPCAPWRRRARPRQLVADARIRGHGA
jgi:hypothetical protein